MARFRRSPIPVDAVQLRWSTWGEVCKLLDAAQIDCGKYEGCYLDAEGRITDDCNGRIGLKIPRPGGRTEIAVEDEWIVRLLDDGSVLVFDPGTFAALFESHADYKVDFEPDWSKYPKLASIFEHRPRVNAYWEELRQLLTEARARTPRSTSTTSGPRSWRGRDRESARSTTAVTCVSSTPSWIFSRCRVAASPYSTTYAAT